MNSLLWPLFVYWLSKYGAKIFATSFHAMKWESRWLTLSWTGIVCVNWIIPVWFIQGWSMVTHWIRVGFEFDQNQFLVLAEENGWLKIVSLHNEQINNSCLFENCDLPNFGKWEWNNLSKRFRESGICNAAMQVHQYANCTPCIQWRFWDPTMTFPRWSTRWIIACN